MPGGFTYGDDISAGKILSNEIKFKLREQISEFIEKGKLIIGICNGFQVLVKCGILPSFSDPFEEQSVSLVTNDSERFEDRWVYLKVYNERSVFTKGTKSMIILPVAHAEGKFVVKDVMAYTFLKMQLISLNPKSEALNAKQIRIPKFKYSKHTQRLFFFKIRLK